MSVAIRRAVIFLAFLAAAGPAAAALPENYSAASLRAKIGSLSDQLRHNQFQRALYLDSSESPDQSEGEIYALVEYPFAAVGAAFRRPSQWCEMMILHVNTKYCGTTTDGAHDSMILNVGRKFDQPLKDSYAFDFAIRVTSDTPDYLQVRLNAHDGPLGTSDYRIVLEAVPLDGNRSFLHFSYSYAYGIVGRGAMQIYLATIGRNKVGFTVTGRQRDGQPDYIRGVRGMVERNTMRYYLAIEAYLGALAAPAPKRFELRLESWFDAIERYPRQLHEMERGAYLDMKRSEGLRQHAAR